VDLSLAAVIDRAIRLLSLLRVGQVEYFICERK